MCTQITMKAEDYEKIKDFIATLDPTASVTHDSSHEHVHEEAPKKKTFTEIIKEYGMTDEQVEFYKKYSMERSRKAYERVAAKELGNAELINDWVYYGYYDAGYRGGDYCDAGHALRYVHIAHNVKTGKEIKFGIKCVTDFFNLSPAQIKFIKNGFNEANEEIQQAIDKYVYYKGDFDKYEEKYHYQAKLDYILEHQPNALRLDNDNLIHMLKLGEIQYIFTLKLFLPNIWERAINYTYNKVKRSEKEQTKQQVFQNNEQQQLMLYLQQNHINIYNIILSLTKSANPTDKQKSFLNKLMSTPWQQVDDIIQQVKDEKIKVKKGYMQQAYTDIIYSFHNYGITEKQFNFLQKTLIK